MCLDDLGLSESSYWLWCNHPGFIHIYSEFEFEYSNFLFFLCLDSSNKGKMQKVNIQIVPDTLLVISFKKCISSPLLTE